MKCPSCGATLPATELECTRCGAHVGWWVRSAEGQESGPYSFLEMQTLIRQERISPLDKVRIGVMGAWRPAPEILRPQPTRSGSVAQSQPVAQKPTARQRLRSLALPLGALVVLGLVVAGTIVARARARTPADGASRACLSNLRHLASALRMYASENDGLLPHWHGWAAAALWHLDDPRAFQCPAAPTEPGYTYNAALGGVPLSRVPKPAECAMLWDSGALGPAVGLTTGFSAPRHDAGDNFAFVDGHAAWRKRGSRVRVNVFRQR